MIGLGGQEGMRMSTFWVDTWGQPPIFSVGRWLVGGWVAAPSLHSRLEENCAFVVVYFVCAYIYLRIDQILEEAPIVTRRVGGQKGLNSA